MGQDSEEAAEFVVTVRTDHVKMKEWYTSSETPTVASLKEKYGAYPQMWRDVLNWPGWKETRKEYLKAEQTKDNAAPAAVPRKRKSRWGSAVSKDNNAAADNQPKRLAAAPPASGAPRVVLPSVTNANLTPQQQQELRDLQAKLRAVNERLDNMEKEAARVDALPRGHRERSPSPPPMYGADGKRKNTRAVRWRERYTADRQDLLEAIMRLSRKDVGLPAGATSLLVRKRVKKIRIPVEEHPNYNFIGLIIGPRGKTQKELEAKTGCKIAIRGRGSVKEGARGRRDGKVMDGDNEPLHVVISGDDQRAVDAASDMVEQMLVVIDDEKNVHKQQQLRELALLNGTLKDEDVFCQICAEKGHRSFECPKRFGNKGGTVGGVKCSICGDASHPTRDCPRKHLQTPGGGGPAAEGTGGNQQQMDSEYQSFMAELDGKKAAAAKNAEPAANGGTDNNVPPPDAKLPPPPQGGLPPPPSGGAPQPPQAAAPSNFNGGGQQQQQDRALQQPGSYGHYQPHQNQRQQQQGHYGNGGGYNQQYNNNNNQGGHYGHGGGQQYGVGYQQQQQQQGGQQQQQQPQQVKPGEETQGWDPSSYYAGGSGGFNWWGN